MDNHLRQNLIASLFALTGQKDDGIFIQRAFVRFAGSLEAGILLGQLLYWTPRARLELVESDGTRSQGWIAKTDDAFADELYLSKYALRKARQSLEEMGILVTRIAKFGGTPTVHYRLDQDALVEAWTSWIEQHHPPLDPPPAPSPAESRKMDLSDSQNPLCESEESFTEITTETTPPPSKPAALSQNRAAPGLQGGGGGGLSTSDLPQAILEGLQAIGYRRHPQALREVAEAYAVDPDLIRGWLAELRAHSEQYQNPAGFFRQSVLRDRTPLPPNAAQIKSTPNPQCSICNGAGGKLQ